MKQLTMVQNIGNAGVWSLAVLLLDYLIISPITFLMEERLIAVSISFLFFFISGCLIGFLFGKGYEKAYLFLGFMNPLFALVTIYPSSKVSFLFYLTLLVFIGLPLIAGAFIGRHFSKKNNV